jgi:hypothetical protein
MQESLPSIDKIEFNLPKDKFLGHTQYMCEKVGNYTPLSKSCNNDEFKTKSLRYATKEPNHSRSQLIIFSMIDFEIDCVPVLMRHPCLPKVNAEGKKELKQYSSTCLISCS